MGHLFIKSYYSQKMVLCLYYVFVKLFFTDERVEHLEASFILLAKRMGYEGIYKKLITKIFYPLLNEWKKGIVKDGVIEQLILILGKNYYFQLWESHVLFPALLTVKNY